MNVLVRPSTCCRSCTSETRIAGSDDAIELAGVERALRPISRCLKTRHVQCNAWFLIIACSRNAHSRDFSRRRSRRSAHRRRPQLPRCVPDQPKHRSGTWGTKGTKGSKLGRRRQRQRSPWREKTEPGRLGRRRRAFFFSLPKPDTYVIYCPVIFSWSLRLFSLRGGGEGLMPLALRRALASFSSVRHRAGVRRRCEEAGRATGEAEILDTRWPELLQMVFPIKSRKTGRAFGSAFQGTSCQQRLS